jgi:hypothetical protein
MLLHTKHTQGSRDVNKIQMLVLAATASIILLMMLFPPLHHVIGSGKVVYAGYGFIFSDNRIPYGSYYGQYLYVNVALLSIQMIVALIVGGIAFLIAKYKP